MADNSITVPWKTVGQKCFKGDKLIAFKMPKIGMVYPRGVVVPKGNQAKILSLTISKIANGWAVSVNYEKDKPVFKPAPEISIGIDLGINPLIAFSNGIKIDNPRWNKKQKKKLKKLARAVSRKQLRSKNRKKAQMRLNRVHQKITNQRKDFYHKLSYRLTETYQNIALEDLNIKGLCEGHLSKSFGEAGLGILTNQLKYKAEEKGREIHLYGRYDRSTGVCPIPKCGWKTPQRLTLDIKKWTCGGCGSIHDRDIAAAQVVESAYKPKTLGKPVPKVVKNALDNSNVIMEGLIVPIQEGNFLRPLRISETLLSLESEVS
jgi:putative transposase